MVISFYQQTFFKPIISILYHLLPTEHVPTPNWQANKKTRTTKVEHKAPGMCGQEYVWTDQHTDKVKCPKMKLRVYSTLQTSFVSSPMLKSLCLGLFDNFETFLTDRPTDRPKRRS